MMVDGVGVAKMTVPASGVGLGWRELELQSKGTGNLTCRE